MEERLLAQAGFLREIFDAIPAMLLIVDDDVRIHHVNATASNGLGLDIRDVHNKRGGEALHCVHSTDVPEGCGRAPACSDCVIRNSVGMAVQEGKIYRKGARMEFGTGDRKKDLHLLVSAAPFFHDEKRYVLLTIENVSELIQLKNLLPICMHCKKIRNDEGYWKDIVEYLNAHLDVDFSHGLCHDCLAKHYPDMAKKGPGGGH
jgi:PAS domain-containing protein